MALAAARLGVAVPVLDGALGARVGDGVDELEAVLLSLVRHPDMEVARARRAGVEGGLRGARLYPNPVLQLGAEEVEPGADLSGAELTFLLQQQVLTAGRYPKRVRAAQQALDAADWNYFEAGVALAAEARGAFLRVLAAQEMVRLAEEQVALAGELVSIVSRRLVAGATTRAELLRAESFQATVETSLQRAWAVRGVNNAELRGLVPGLPAEAVWVGELPEAGPQPATWGVELEVARSSPQLRRLEAAREAARAQVEVARTGRHPNVTVGVGVRRNRAVDDTSYMANLSLPLPTSNRNQGGIAQASAKVAEVSAELASAGLRVRAQARGLMVTLEKLREQALTYRNVVVPKAREALELSHLGFQRGKFAYLNVLDAQRELAGALRNELQLRLQYGLTRVQLDAVLGYPGGAEVGGGP